MMSKVISQTLGISKKAALTIVRIPESIPTQQEIAQSAATGRPFNTYRFLAILEALSSVYNDYNSGTQATQPRRKIVVNLAYTVVPVNYPNNPPLPGDVYYPVWDLMRMMAAQGVIFVTVAGNDGATVYSNVCLKIISRLNAEIIV
jgi:hypothetical protein